MLQTDEMENPNKNKPQQKDELWNQRTQKNWIKECQPAKIFMRNILNINYTYKINFDVFFFVVLHYFSRPGNIYIFTLVSKHHQDVLLFCLTSKVFFFTAWWQCEIWFDIHLLMILLTESPFQKFHRMRNKNTFWGINPKRTKNQIEFQLKTKSHNAVIAIKMWFFFFGCLSEVDAVTIESKNFNN